MNNGALPTHLKPLREPTVYKEGFGGTLVPLAAAVAVQALSVRVVAEGV